MKVYIWFKPTLNGVNAIGGVCASNLIAQKELHKYITQQAHEYNAKFPYKVCESDYILEYTVVNGEEN